MSLTKVKSSTSGNDVLKKHATFAAAIAAGVKIGDTVQIGERANGEFLVVDATTVTENGFDIVTGDATRSFQLIISDGVANIAQFGAAKAPLDATGAIQAAINSTEASAVYTPAFEYNHTGLVLAKEKRYFGEGMQSSKWTHTGVGGNGVSYTGAAAAKIIMEDLWIAGNGVDTARSLYIKNGYFNTLLNRMRINDGIINAYLESSWTLTIDGCHMYGASNDDKGITQNNLVTDGWEAGVLNNSRLEDCLGDNIVIDQINGPATNFFTIGGSTKIQRCNGRGIYGKVGQGKIHAYFERVNDDNLPSDTITITAATQANPVVITATNTLNNGDIVDISGVNGMTELNNNTYAVSTVSGTGFTLENIDGTGFTAYTSGGTATQYTAAIQMNEGGYTQIENTYLTNSGANTRFVNFNGNTLNIQSSHQSSSGGAVGILTSNGTPNCVSIGNRYFVATPYKLNSTANVVLDQTSEFQMFEGSLLVGAQSNLNRAAYALDVYATNKDIRYAGNTNLKMYFNSPANRGLDFIFQAGGTNKIVMGRGDSDVISNDIIYWSNVSNDTNPPMSINVATGQVRMSDLPTSSPGGSGNLWNNSGVLNIT